MNSNDKDEIIKSQAATIKRLTEALERTAKAYHNKTKNHDDVYGSLHDADFQECTAPICRDNRAVLAEVKQ